MCVCLAVCVQASFCCVHALSFWLLCASVLLPSSMGLRPLYLAFVYFFMHLFRLIEHVTLLVHTPLDFTLLLLSLPFFLSFLSPSTSLTFM